MEKIAFLWQGTGRPVYWRMIFIALGVLTFLLLLTACRTSRGKNPLSLLLIAPVLGAAALYGARLVYWYCRVEAYSSLGEALRELEKGDFSLAGAIAGGLCGCALLRLVRIVDDLPGFLDDVGTAAAGGIAVGRLGDMFGVINHGRMIIEDEARHVLPWASAVYNGVSGTYEWRFATFCFQSIWAAAILLILLLGHFRRRKKAFVLFMTLYCLGQILFESTRYDALFLRSNGFVSMEQILCAAVLLTVLAAASVRRIRQRGFSAGCVFMWTLFLAGLGLTGYMEYYVQRHGEAYVTVYCVMAAALALVFASVWLAVRSAAGTPEPSRGQKAA